MLYGTFAFLRKIALGESVAKLDEKQSPYAPVRWVNEWNNLDGTIERGYGGRSIFWDKLQAREDLTRVGEYGRLLASLGINACSINNVNANPRVLAADFIPQVVRIAEAFRPWGVRVALAVDFGSPKTLGGLDTFDPLEPKVASWWKDRVDALYARRPRPRRLRAEGGFRRPRRPRHLRPNARRRRQSAGTRPATARRPALLSRLRLRPSRRLDQSEERPRPRRLRQLPTARRQVRRQRDRADQTRPHRFPGARTGLAPFRRAGEDQSGHRTANHAGVLRPVAPHRLPRPHVERGARFRHARPRRRDAGEGPGGRQDFPPAHRRLRRRLQRRASTKTGTATTCRRPTSTASAASPGIPI